MVNNCNRRPYLLKNDEQQKRKCNRFMAKFNFDKSIALIVLFVSVFLFPCKYFYVPETSSCQYAKTADIIGYHSE